MDSSTRLLPLGILQVLWGQDAQRGPGKRYPCEAAFFGMCRIVSCGFRGVRLGHWRRGTSHSSGHGKDILATYQATGDLDTAPHSPHNATYVLPKKSCDPYTTLHKKNPLIYVSIKYSPFCRNPKKRHPVWQHPASCVH